MSEYNQQTFGGHHDQHDQSSDREKYGDFILKKYGEDLEKVEIQTRNEYDIENFLLTENLYPILPKPYGDFPSQKCTI